MMYYKALRDGLDDLPQADLALRAELEARAAREGWPALHAELATLDPITAARLAPNDSQRIQRALEICRLSGQPMSALLLRAQRSKPDEDANQYLTISLEPSDRAALHARIEQRFDAMLAQGLIDEVRALRARAATCIPACPRCAAWATARCGRTWTARSTWPARASKASPPRASWPSARSPGCGRSLSVSSSIAWRGTRWRARSTRWPPRWANAPDTSTGPAPRHRRVALRLPPKMKSPP